MNSWRDIHFCKSGLEHEVALKHAFMTREILTIKLKLASVVFAFFIFRNIIIIIKACLAVHSFTELFACKVNSCQLTRVGFSFCFCAAGGCFWETFQDQTHLERDILHFTWRIDAKGKMSIQKAVLCLLPCLISTKNGSSHWWTLKKCTKCWHDLSRTLQIFRRPSVYKDGLEFES